MFMPQFKYNGLERVVLWIAELCATQNRLGGRPNCCLENLRIRESFIRHFDWLFPFNSLFADHMYLMALLMLRGVRQFFLELAREDSMSIRYNLLRKSMISEVEIIE